MGLLGRTTSCRMRNSAVDIRLPVAGKNRNEKNEKAPPWRFAVGEKRRRGGAALVCFGLGCALITPAGAHPLFSAFRRVAASSQLSHTSTRPSNFPLRVMNRLFGKCRTFSPPVFSGCPAKDPRPRSGRIMSAGCREELWLSNTVNLVQLMVQRRTKT